MVFVKKLNGSLQMCIDYQKLNELTTKNSYPFPRIDNLFDQLNGVQVSTRLDLETGFCQL